MSVEVEIKAPVSDLNLYESIADPPLVAGRSKSMVTTPLVPAPCIFSGTPGTVSGVTLFDELLSVPVHTPLTATTVNVYGVPLVSQLIVIGLHVHVATILSGDDVTT